MQIKTWSNFSKRVNSTKQPLDSAATTKDVTLKDMCDILAPSFILNTTDFDINYVQAFGNYYFAQCINLDGHRTEIKCSLDHLATFKSEIGSYNGLIEYCSVSSNVSITDPRNKPTLELATNHNDFVWLSGQGLDANAGTFILSFLSDQPNSTGLVKYVAMDWYGLSQFSYELFSQTIADEVKKQFTNMTDALVSLYWLPIDYDNLVGTVTSTFTVGKQPITLTDSQGKILTQRIHTIETGSTLVAFPSAGVGAADIRNTYLAKAPYLTSELYLPFIGNVPMSEDLIACFNSGLKLKGAIDVMTGDIVYSLYVDSQRVATYNGNIATQLPIGSASYNAFSTITGALTAVGGVGAAVLGIGTGNLAMAAGGLAGVARGAAETAKSVSVHTQINGSNSSAVAQTMGTTPTIINILAKPVETNLLSYQAKHGMPYFKVGTVSACGGFVQCADASVSIPGDGAEQDTVNSYLNAGIYYE